MPEIPAPTIRMSKWSSASALSRSTAVETFMGALRDSGRGHDSASPGNEKGRPFGRPFAFMSCGGSK